MWAYRTAKTFFVISLNWIKWRKIIFNRPTFHLTACVCPLYASRLTNLINFLSLRSIFQRCRVLSLMCGAFGGRASMSWPNPITLIDCRTWPGTRRIHEGASRANFFSLFRINRFRRGSVLRISSRRLTHWPRCWPHKERLRRNAEIWFSSVAPDCLPNNEINHRSRCKTWMRKEEEEDKQLDIQLKQMIHAFYEWSLSWKIFLPLNWRSPVPTLS